MIFNHPFVLFQWLPTGSWILWKLLPFLLSLPFLSSSVFLFPFASDLTPNWEAVVREDGTFQLISFVFLHLQVNQASHTYLFSYGVTPQNQSLVEGNRFFSFEMPWIWIEIRCHRWKSSPLSPAPLGGPPREQRRHPNLAFPLRWVRETRRPPVTAHAMCRSARHQEFGFICLPIQFYLSQTVFFAVILCWSYRMDSAQTLWRSLEIKTPSPAKQYFLHIISALSAVAALGREHSCKLLCRENWYSYQFLCCSIGEHFRRLWGRVSSFDKQNYIQMYFKYYRLIYRLRTTFYSSFLLNGV